MTAQEPTTDGDLWEVLGSKWTFPIVSFLAERDARFDELERGIDGLSANTLSTRLDDLRAVGLVSRRVDETASPPSVTYALTEKGTDLAGIVERIEALEERYRVEGSG